MQNVKSSFGLLPFLQREKIFHLQNTGYSDENLRIGLMCFDHPPDTLEHGV